MATLHTIKRQSESPAPFFVSLLIQTTLSCGAAYLAWTYLQQQWIIALGAGLGIFLLLGIWGFFVRWQTAVIWLCRFQLNLVKLNLLPKDFVFWDDASPINVQPRIEESFKAALLTVQNHEKAIVSQRHILEKYLGSEASRQAQGSNTNLGGQLQKVFILFSDIRGFTRMSEQLTPQETMRVLNRVYTALGTAIEVQGGEINKFIGDAVLAYFRRSPENEKLDAQKTVEAALEMQEKFLQAVRSIPELNSKSITIGLGIGLVAGEALMGNLGTRNRMEFTLIGDAVNLASRLCGLAPESEILVNEELALLVSERYHIESRMPVQLKGKSEKVTPYCIMGDMSHHNAMRTPS